MRHTLRAVAWRDKECTGCYSSQCYIDSMSSYFRIDRYVTSVLMRDLIAHDRTPAAFLLYLYLAGACSEQRQRRVELSLAALADATGLARRTVQLAIAHLKRRRLIQVTQAHTTATPQYRVLRPWRRSTRPTTS